MTPLDPSRPGTGRSRAFWLAAVALTCGLFTGAPDAAPRIVPDHAPPVVVDVGLAQYSPASGDQFGYVVVSLADFNRDGYVDWAVAAPVSDLAGLDAGAVFIYFGAAVPDTVPDLVLLGEAPGDKLGESMTVLDFDGDFRLDLAVGADGNDAAGFNAGRVYLYRGGADVDAIADFVFTGQAGADFYGFSCAASDLNGDGHRDLVVGAPLHDSFGLNNAGRVYAYWGGPAADTTADLRFNGAAPDDQFGRGLTGLGDFDGDGVEDLAIGAPFHDDNGNDAGMVRVFFGGPIPDSLHDDEFVGVRPGGQFGAPLGVTDDFDGNGSPELIVAAPGDGAGLVQLFDREGGPAPLFAARGAIVGDRFGTALEGRDLNDDGHGDLTVGSPRASEVRVYWGGADADTFPDLVMSGAAGEGIGFSVARLPDLFRDAAADLLIGAVNSLFPPLSGRFQIIDIARYRVTRPLANDRQGELLEVSWRGAEPATLALSRDGGITFAEVARQLGGEAENSWSVPIRGAPSGSAIVRLTPSDPSVRGEARSDAFTVGAPAAGGRIGAWPSPVHRGARLRVTVALPAAAWGRDRPDLEIAIYDVRGRRIETLTRGGPVSGTGVAETHWVVPSGLGYQLVFVRAWSASLGFEETRRLVVLDHPAPPGPFLPD